MVDLSARSRAAGAGDLLQNAFVCCTAALIFALVEGGIFLDGKAAASAEFHQQHEALKQENEQLRQALRQANAPMAATVRQSRHPSAHGAPVERAKYLLAIS